MTIHSALSIPCRGRFYPLDCNKYVNNKFSNVEFIITDEISWSQKTGLSNSSASG